MSIYTDGKYLHDNPGWHEADSPWKAGRVFRLLSKNRIRPSTVCEIGCGSGTMLSELARMLGGDARFDGFDISPQAIALAQSRATAAVRFHRADFLSLEPADPPYDLLLSIDVMEHVPDYLGFLASLRNRARYKIFNIPLDLSVQSVLRLSPLTEARARSGHLHYFVKETALATLQYTGYEILDWEYTSGALELFPKSIGTWLGWLPRRIGFSLAPDLAVRVFGGFSVLVLAR